MTIDTNTMISITEANLVIDFCKAEKEKVADMEDVLTISERLIKQNMEAYEALAK